MDILQKYLNPEELQAVRTTEGPLLVFAGAGTGKTRVITYRLAYLLQQGVNPASILAVTFTNKAAEEMRQRVNILCPGKAFGVWITTFHSLAARILRQDYQLLNRKADFVIYDENDQKTILRQCLKELNLPDKKFHPGHLREVISRAKDDLIDAESFMIYAEASDDLWRQTVAKIYQLYQQKLNQNNALDFGDLLLQVAAALKENQLFRQKYQQQFRYIMVDEYQDTNRAQYVLLKYLVGPHQNICVVGDDDQSIYTWRGANPQNIQEFRRDWPNARIITLQENYRSSPQILDCAWRLISNNQMRHPKKLWTKNCPAEPVYFSEFDTEIAEARNIAEKIQYLQREKHIALNEIAVFYRTNAQSRVLEEAFRYYEIPYRIYGTVRFYERAEIKNILAYLRLIYNPNDDVSFLRVINIPSRGLGEKSLQQLQELARKYRTGLLQTLNYLGELNWSESKKQQLQNFQKMISDLRQLSQQISAYELALLVYERSGYHQELKDENTLESRNRQENIEELFNSIDEFGERTNDTSLAAYLQQASLLTASDEIKSEQKSVSLMTLHLAKGLEFHTVFISGLEENILPHHDALLDENELEEERRLMYVGITRAKKNLFLSSAQQRRLYNRRIYNPVSRFVAEAIAERDPGSEPVAVPESAFGQTRWQPGSRIRHPIFGPGIIAEKTGRGEDLKLLIKFDSGIWKKIMVKYANLEKL